MQYKLLSARGFFCGKAVRSLCLLEIRADIGESAVLHAEAAWDCAELCEAETFVEMPGVDVPFGDGVELKYLEAMRLGLSETVEDELLAEMPTTTV